MPGELRREDEVIRSPLERAHTIIYSQSYSPCHNYLAVCDNIGVISLFRLSDALSPNQKKEDLKPYFAFHASDHAIYSLISHNDSLICGGNKKLSCYPWADLISKSPKISWSLKIPASGVGLAEANSLQICSETGSLYAGCGDGNIHCWDLSSGTHKCKYGGHSDVIQAIKVSQSDNKTQLYSASEDGTVRIWDTRSPSAESIHCLNPSKQDNIARPPLGRFLACVDVQGDSIVCGGGPRLSMWSGRTLTPLTVMDTGNSTQHTSLFNDDLLMTGGSGRQIYHWYMNGECKTKVPVTPNTVYNISINDQSKDKKVLTVCGSGYKLDVCLNYGYKSFTYEV